METFFVNKVAFFTTVSDHIKFTTAQHIKSRKRENIVDSLDKVKNVYTAHGFDPKLILMDGEFVPIQEDILKMDITLNTCAANEHVPKIERQIRVIKERVRCTRHTLPFKVIPLLMLIEMIYSSVL